MLVIYGESSNALSYTLKTVFSDWLSIEWRFVEEKSHDLRITLENYSGELLFPNSLFRKLTSNGLDNGILPEYPLQKVKGFSFLSEGDIEQDLPILYSDGLIESNTIIDVDRSTTIDLFGSIFFMLSRLEEVILTERDVHDRFLSSDSISVKYSFIDRPIVDEYVEVLWGILKSYWNNLERLQNKVL